MRIALRIARSQEEAVTKQALQRLLHERFNGYVSRLVNAVLAKADFPQGQRKEAEESISPASRSFLRDERGLSYAHQLYLLLVFPALRDKLN